MSFTLRELPGAGPLAAHAAALAAIALLFAFIGPFGTYDAMGPLARLGYWALAMAGNWGLFAAATLLVLHLIPKAAPLRQAAALALAALLAALPGAAIVFAAETLFRPGYSDIGALPEIYLGVAVLGLAVSALALAAHRLRRDRRPARPPPAPPPRFLARLPARIGRDLVYLKMADHYVEAVTTRGSGLVLMRFADAIAELDGAEGLRVHRSYWVARAHVAGSERRGGRAILRLTGGHEVPVSRTYLPKARAAGLI